MLLDARIREMFDQLPLLIGFSVDGDLSGCDITLHAVPGSPWSDRVHHEIGAELADLIVAMIDDGEGERLRGRTFARALH